MFKGKNANYRVLGLFCAKMPTEDVKNTVDSICASANKAGWRVMIFTAFCDFFNRTNETAGEASIFKVFNTDILDAAVILPETIKNDEVCLSIIADAMAGNIPVITVDKKYDGVPCVRFDYISTFEKIVEHVFAYHGCRTVNFMAGTKGNDFSEKRLDCYKKALAERDIPFDERRVGYGDFWENPTIKAMDEFMESSLPIPEAIICCNDSMAITVCQYLSKKGIKVPEDVIVTGFDGIELEKYYHPRLTTGVVDYAVFGSAVMDMVLDSLEHKAPDSRSIHYKIQLGGSCGCVNNDSHAACDKIITLYDRVSNSAWHEDYMFNFLRKATRCNTLNELADVMSHYGDYCEWFCINTDIFEKEHDAHRYHGAFTQSMNCMLERDMDWHDSSGTIFRTSDILPDIERTLEKFEVLYFTPLNYMDEILGYTCAAIGYSDEFVYSNRRRYISNTAQILENFINRIKLERVNSELAEMHIRDPLTGLLNRRGFYKYFDRLSSDGKMIYLFSVDMDRLKYINDTFGHNEGDRAIKAVAASLTAAPGCSLVCARFGGDEFEVIGFGDDFSPDDYIAEVKAYLASYNRSSGAPYRVEVSVGWEKTDLSKADENNAIDDIIRIADARMYEDKRSRKAAREQQVYSSHI